MWGKKLKIFEDVKKKITPELLSEVKRKITPNIVHAVKRKIRPNLFDSFKKKITPDLLKNVINYWPPFIGAGIKVKNISSDFLSLDVEMKLYWYNKNYVGTHFGGSLFSMTDPFYMLILINTLGSHYIVWDKSANIEFLRPGKGKVTAHFEFSPEEIAQIREDADRDGKVVFTKKVDILDHAGKRIASVEKTLFVKKKTS